jgi:processive 1,2-diacylglycerol beta-glucosyltransferase
MKILVIYATAGAGHRKAAEAISKGFVLSSHQVHYVDALDYTSRFYKHIYTQTYTFLISRIPWLWGLLFRLLDIPALLPLVRSLRRIQNAIHAGPLARFLVREQFDCIFSTHFFPCEVASYLKRQGRISSRLICTVTDYDVLSIWVSRGVDYYTVATDWTKRKMQHLGVPDSLIAVTGIPTDEKFSQHKNLGALRTRLGLQPGETTVLVATGSFGIGPIEEIINQLNGFQLVVVCGHNESLYQKLSQQKKTLVKVCGLVDNMDELMAASDVMVTKPGGLSISEALVTGLPLVFFNAIPGQETNNIKVLETYGIGRLCVTVDQIAQTLRGFKNDPQALSAAKSRVQLLARPGAVKDIIKLL